MIYIFLSICCNITVAVLFKLAKRYHINTTQAIVWNYAIALVLSGLIFRPQLPAMFAAPVELYSILGLLLPAMFVVIAGSVRNTGIVRTDVAQRLSLFIPVIAAYAVFGESFTSIKTAGIILGFTAILCSIPWKKSPDAAPGSKSAWLYLLTVFIGMGVIDVLFKKIATHPVPFTASLFIIYLLAFGVSVLVLSVMFATGRMKFEWINVLCGFILGIFNFGNILFYLKAHQVLAATPSIVFSSMNIGVIILGSLVGVIIFKEKLSRLNYFGIALAIVAIVVISIA